ncbi:MAG: hypothetical protein ACSHX0_02120 [Akkermansiaceae bacterium]
MQLQKLSPEFTQLNTEILSVFREEKEGVEGAKKAFMKTKFSPILLDSPAEKTARYSQNDFATYFIDQKGIVKAVLSGTKKNRPTGEIILAEAKKAFNK